MQKRLFYSAISAFGANLSPGALKEIAASFDDGTGTCNYFLFLQSLDRFVLPPPKATQRVIDVPDELRKATDPNVLLENAKKTIEVRRIEADAHFAPLSREGAGDLIPISRFVRIVSGMKIDLTVEEIEAIAGLFAGEYGTVKWRDFLGAVCPKVVALEVDAESVVARLKDYLKNSFMTFASSAARFDREGSGCISGPQLMSTLQFIRFEYTNAEISAIRSAYPGTTPGSINWQVLSQLVDPKKEVAAAPGDRDLEAEQKKDQGNPPPPTVAAIVEKINNGCASRGAVIFDEFRVYDRMRKGTVQQENFMAFVYSLPVQFTPAELRTVIAFYRVSGSSEVNYVALCRDIQRIQVEREAEQKRATIAAQSKPAEPVHVEVPQTVHQFLKRFKTFCEQMRVIAAEIFVPYDIGHNGTLPVFKVQACFNNVNFPVLRTEIEQIVTVFRDSRKPELFNYVNFAHALSEEDISSAEVRATLASAPISAEIEREALVTCSQIREKLMARHRRIDNAFAGLTEIGCTSREFQTRLASVDLVLRAGQIQALLRMYRVNLTDQVDWRRFCNDVNKSKTVGF